MVGGRGLGRIFLTYVAHGVEPRLAERGVVVGIDLAVQCKQVAAGDDRERIEFHQREVQRVEHAVEAAHDLGELADLLAVEPHREADFAAVVGLQTLDEVDVKGVDLLRRFVRDLLDVDAAAGGGDEGDGPGAAIDEAGEIQLLLDVVGLGDEHAVNRQRAATGLIGDHAGAEHLAGHLAGLLRRLRQLDATGLTAATGMDLRLDHPLRAPEGAGSRLGLFRRACNDPLRHGNAEVREQFLRLVFVKVHRGFPAGAAWPLWPDRARGRKDAELSPKPGRWRRASPSPPRVSERSRHPSHGRR